MERHLAEPAGNEKRKISLLRISLRKKRDGLRAALQTPNVPWKIPFQGDMTAVRGPPRRGLPRRRARARARTTDPSRLARIVPGPRPRAGAAGESP
ncbi:hypothetical protein SDC9_38102 [bioreactor metagenome]|uniref:Uncharacterized protein n=1 Tax=bioreactor metagenome TaxID=1076179 RepID=A0A644VNG4_9ZZZZ